MSRRRLNWDSSYLSVDWTQPVNGSHRLNQGLQSFHVATPHRSYGTVFRDLIGWYNFTGTNTEQTDWSTPTGALRPGGWGCIDLGGTNEYFAYTVAAIPTAFPVTKTCWASFTNFTSGPALMASTNSGNGEHYLNMFAATDGTLSMETGWGVALSRLGPTTTFAMSTGTWYHCAAVWAATNDRRVYINGANKVSETNATTFPTNNRTDFGAGLNTGGPWGPMTGQLDCLRIYNRILSDDEVLEEYELTSRFCDGLLNRRRRVKYFVAAVGAGHVLRDTSHHPSHQAMVAM